MTIMNAIAIVIAIVNTISIAIADAMVNGNYAHQNALPSGAFCPVFGGTAYHCCIANCEYNCIPEMRLRSQSQMQSQS